MNGVVVYESHYGNTKLVAEKIAEELEASGHQVELRNVRQRFSQPPRGDIAFMGSPVRMGSVSGNVKRFLKNFDADAWKGKPIAVFTTILALPNDATAEQKQSQEKWDRGAGRKLAELVKLAGLAAVGENLCVEVKGMKGPLVETGVESARQFVRETLRSLNR